MHELFVPTVSRRASSDNESFLNESLTTTLSLAETGARSSDNSGGEVPASRIRRRGNAGGDWGEGTIGGRVGAR